MLVGGAMLYCAARSLMTEIGKGARVRDPKLPSVARLQPCAMRERSKRGMHIRSGSIAYGSVRPHVLKNARTKVGCAMDRSCTESKRHE